MHTTPEVETQQVFTTPNPAFHIVVGRQQSGVGRELWLGEVRDTATGQVLQIDQEVPAYEYGPAVMRNVTIAAIRFGAIDRLDQLVETLQELAPKAVAAWNRAEMVEKIAQIRWDDGTHEQILDAILPQVTTVEELEALPAGTVLVSDKGYPYWLTAADVLPRSALSGLGPLTIVWQP